MQIKRAVGRGGATQKYDLLTILGAFALSQDKTLQRQVLRLICLITARYNWQNDQLTIGQQEIARLWSVDPRTVKREMAALRARGWLVEKRAPARGRVTLYGLGFERIMLDTREVWKLVGPDLVERLSPEANPEVETAKVIPFPQNLPSVDGSLWGELSRALHDEDPAIFRAWFAPLHHEMTAEVLMLTSPGSYHANYLKTHLAQRIEHHMKRLAPGMRLHIQG